jgi:hypothetical protein
METAVIFNIMMSMIMSAQCKSLDPKLSAKLANPNSTNLLSIAKTQKLLRERNRGEILRWSSRQPPNRGIALNLGLVLWVLKILALVLKSATLSSHHLTIDRNNFRKTSPIRLCRAANKTFGNSRKIQWYPRRNKLQVMKRHRIFKAWDSPKKEGSFHILVQTT